MDIYHIAVKQTLMNYSYCIMQMSDGHFSTMMWNAIHMATHGLTTVNISPLRLLVIILLLLKSNIQFHHECYRTIAALLAQQVVHHKLESDSLCHFHAEVIAYMFVKEIAHSLGFENTAFFTQFFKRFTGSTPQEYRKH